MLKFILVIIYVILSFTIFFMVDCNYNITIEDISPKFFYNKGMNWFASYLIFILFMLINPIGLFVRIIESIYLGVEWLLTVGRKKDD